MYCLPILDDAYGVVPVPEKLSNTISLGSQYKSMKYFANSDENVAS